MNAIHIFVAIGFAKTDAAAILMNFASPCTILVLGIELRISISAVVYKFSCLIFIPFYE
jgi:hypothetical protein